MAAIIVIPDLPAGARSHELAQQMVDGANAKAARVAPCLVSTDPEPSADQLAEAKLILIGAVERWAEAGTGARQSQTAGPFGMTLDSTSPRKGYNLWPSEIKDLQAICKGDGDDKKAFSVDTIADGTNHSENCTLLLGGNYCSCGADIAGFPLFENDVVA